MLHIKKIFTLGKDERYEKGMTYYNRCEYKNALGQFEDMLSNKQYKNTLHYNLSEFYSSQSYRNLGIVAMHEARFRDAIGYFEKSLEILPDATVLRSYLGICYNNIGLYGEAISEFEAVLAENKDDIQIDVRLALAYFNRGDYRHAMERLKAVIAARPEHADLRYLSGLMLCNRHDYKCGITEFNKALELNPVYEEALLKNGLAHTALGKYKEAEGIFRQLVKIADDESARKYLDLTCNVLGRDAKPASAGKKALADKVSEEFSKTIMINYTFTSILTPLESNVKDIGLYNTLARIYRNVLEEHPNYADFHHKLGQVYENLHKYRLAINEYRKAIEINPDYVHAHISAAFIYKNAGEIDKAIREFEFVVNKHTELPVVYYQLALLYKDKNDRARAIEFAAKALELQPDFKDAKELLKALRG